MNPSIIPSNYDEWRYCITVECGLALSQNFIEKRVVALQNKNDHYTQQFMRTYGAEHHAKVLNWFLQARSEL